MGQFEKLGNGEGDLALKFVNLLKYLYDFNLLAPVKITAIFE